LDDSLDRIADLVSRHLPGGPGAAFGPDADLREAGLDSMGIVALLVALEGEFGIEFPDELITPATFTTIRNLHQIVRGLSIGWDRDPAAGDASLTASSRGSRG
jgi:acyl carrier protein